MKKIFQYISIFCCSCFTALLGSCSSDDMSGNAGYSAAEVGGEVELTLNVRIGNTTGVAGTRDGENDDDNKFGFEQSDIEYELIKTLRVIVVRPDFTVEYNRFINLADKKAVSMLADDEELKFRVSTDLGVVDNAAMTCTERKRIYLIANEASLDAFKSNLTGDGQSITYILDHLRPTYKPADENESGYPGDKLSPYTVDKWLIYKEWPGGVGTPGNYAVPAIDNTEENKSYIPMTEFFDVDAVSTWKKALSGSDDGNDLPPKVIQTQKADLFITRNFVKFRFTAWSETEKFDIVSLRFENVMQKEYLFPLNTVYEPVKAINNPVNRQIISFQTPGLAGNFTRPYLFTPAEKLTYVPSAPGVEPKPLIFVPQLYFCETQNYVSNTNNTPVYSLGATIKYYKTDGTEETVTYESVELDNLPYSLPRNTVVGVNLKIKDRKLKATVTVFPYTAVNLNPEFGFSPPVSDYLTVAPLLELNMNDPTHREGLLEATYTSESGTELTSLIWVSTDDSIVKLGDNIEKNPLSQLYVKPSESIELPIDQPVRVVPVNPGTTYVTVYSQNGLVARCKVVVK